MISHQQKEIKTPEKVTSPALTVGIVNLWNVTAPKVLVQQVRTVTVLPVVGVVLWFVRIAAMK